MARPRKEYAIRRNGNSVQLFRQGVLCGSLPLSLLCELAVAKRSGQAITTQPLFPNKD